MIDLLPPQNIEAEQSILSSCMLDPKAVETSIDIISSDDFYKTAHGKIYSAIKSLYHNKKPVDSVSVAEELITSGNIELIGGGAYLYQLLNECPMAVNIEHSCNIVKTKSQARRFIQSASKYVRSCYESSDTDLAQILDDAQSEIIQIGMDMKADSFTTMKDLTEQSIDRYQALNEGKAKGGIKTGFQTFDILTGGLKGSLLMIMAARPGIGKTAMMCTMVKNVAQRGEMAGVFELEMDKEALDDRWMAQATGINSMRFRYGTGPNREEWIKITDVAEDKYSWPVLIDDSGGMKIGELRRRIRQMVRMGCGIIFIDQLSFIQSSDRKLKEWEYNTRHVKALGFIKKELRIPIVLLCQLNRDLEKRGNKKPVLSDLKMTGQLEEEADIVLLGYRKHPYTKKEEDVNHAEWEIAKHRNGPTRNIKMNWHPKTQSFTEAQNDS